MLSVKNEMAIMAAAAEEHIDNTIASLKIIGMVPRNGKLCVRKGQLSIDDCNNSQGFRRWFRGDSRDITLMHVRNTIGSAVKIGKLLMDAYSNAELAAWTLDRMAREMEQCEVGLQNLKTTYSADSMMVANIDVLCDRLHAHKNEVTRFIDDKESDEDAARMAMMSA